MNLGTRRRLQRNQRQKQERQKASKMEDYIVRATAANAQIRAFAATTRVLTEEARQRHNTSPVATAALGRLLTAGAMMGAMMKGEQDILTLQVNGDGPLGGIIVTANSKAEVKGYVHHPEVVNEANYLGNLDVGGAVGYGTLKVIKDMGMKEPYSGEVDLITGELAEDLTYYFATSEQIPSSVALGVLMNKENTVRQAGGFILQLMPFADEAVISRLEQKIGEIKSITELLDKGMTPEQLLEQVIGEFDMEITDKIPTTFSCNCSKERVSRAVAGISMTDLDEIIADDKPIEVKCHFCNTAYEFSIEELKELRACRRRLKKS